MGIVSEVKPEEVKKSMTVEEATQIIKSKEPINVGDILKVVFFIEDYPKAQLAKFMNKEDIQETYGDQEMRVISIGKSFTRCEWIGSVPRQILLGRTQISNGFEFVSNKRSRTMMLKKIAV